MIDILRATVKTVYGNHRYYRAISVSKFCRLAEELMEDKENEA